MNATRNGVLVASEGGTALSFGLANAQERGTTFIEPGAEVYEGMIVGLHIRENDLAVNVCRAKQKTNIRSSTSEISVRLTPPTLLSLEQSLDFVNEDELVEVTPKALRLRKRLLDPNEREIKRLMPRVGAINALEPEMQKLSDEQLRAKTDEFRARLAQGATLDDILPEAFAVVRETGKRVLGQRHFDVQLMGGIVLHRGMIAAMKTGEGKTLVSTLPVYLNALTGSDQNTIAWFHT